MSHTCYHPGFEQADIRFVLGIDGGGTGTRVRVWTYGGALIGHGEAGPSALATVMLLTSQAPGKMYEWIGALTVTMIVCAIVLMLAERIQKWLGERTMTAFERSRATSPRSSMLRVSPRRVTTRILPPNAFAISSSISTLSRSAMMTTQASR